jgi:hypothetical protein
MKITVELTVGVDGAAVYAEEVDWVADNLVKAIKLTLPQRWNGLVRTLIIKDVELKEARLEEKWGQ